MAIDSGRVRRLLQEFSFTDLFVDELGWDHLRASPHPIALDGATYTLRPVAHKRGFQVFECSPDPDGNLPERSVRMKIDRELAKTAAEHLIIFVDAERTSQAWQWVRRDPGRPLAARTESYTRGQFGERLVQKVAALAFSLDEEESLTIAQPISRARQAFDVDRVTRRFYDRFKTEHAAFLKFIHGIATQADREWYASLMLNRLMFIYFIQKKGFLARDLTYLRNRLRMIRTRHGTGQFLSFYRQFLLKLFHEGLGQQIRSAEVDALLGKVPYLNGGLFDVHELERTYQEIDIDDQAFERIFGFFDEWDWHLDERPLRDDREINPDVLGYIFEKYVNQKQMGAYYTKEDITGYIARNTIIPYLFDAARKECAIAFRPDGALWGLLRENPDRYIYKAVRKGVHLPLPAGIAAGLDDVAERGGWNRPADPDYALPTETWREHVARRRRYEEVWDKLVEGEVHSIDNLITYNLDIRQFAQDVIESCEGPELLRAFYHAIEKVTVLDPACGSGAFLFAALSILEPLYEACLERMQAFLDDLARSGEPHRPEKFSDFRKTLERVQQHPNHRYFILKSIIIGNLYGVDIMEEAVEICKLRLFLKLVAQVENAEHVEPLPDIDFNIRAGNTIVGFASLEDVRAAVTRGASGQLKLVDADSEATLQRVEEGAEIADRAFQKFREMQTEHSMEAGQFADAKAELRRRLNALGEELDRHLAREYGVALRQRAAYQGWRSSHQPFHWFVEFFSITMQGGFSAIIGNPPYVELNALEGYRTLGYTCEQAGNLYALMLERSSKLCSDVGRQGFIVPVSSVSTDRYVSLQELLTRHRLHYSSFDDRPSRLFEGLEHSRLTIHLLGPPVKVSTLSSTRYRKWASVERPQLFETLTYATSRPSLITCSLPKLSSEIEHGLLNKAETQNKSLKQFYSSNSEYRMFYSRKLSYFVQALDFEPLVLDGRGNRRPPSEFKELRFRNKAHSYMALCCLNASLFYWFVTVFSDCRHVNRREVDAFPIDLEKLATKPLCDSLVGLAEDLMADVKQNSHVRKMRFGHDTLTVQHIFPKRSKPIIDQIDRVLAEHYGFTAEELDFIINYDIKYRMGRDADEEDRG